MSFAIDEATVRAVLLADGWHKVANNSFKVGSYEFVRGDAKNQQPSTAGAVGFRLKDDAGYILCGPLTGVIATQGR